ncbi:MAG: anaerobic ribonucleoside-triphosphate reductase activating protein [Paludibacteraceae bacterium]|nr:anaerobic ribonucleoside-triphosphate reductase activating protein [Paludibacteraceae bacterium]MBO7316218.1 anaerobic ribonucleoside-triphosphate reductase activating protein [Paludibacteraceae bacterium]
MDNCQLKYTDYDVVFQEIPNEVTLAINLSRCPNRCEGCHSAYLMDDVGEYLTTAVIDSLCEKYGSAVTCICFMGGDIAPFQVADLAQYISEKKQLKTAWYSGKKELPKEFPLNRFNFVKIGPYVPKYGPLNSPTTNQRLYKIEQGEMMDITSMFWKKSMVV